MASAGAWPPAAEVPLTRVPLGDVGPLRAVVLGARRGGRPYPAEGLRLLEEAERLTAAAIRPG